jgi:serine/threonine protein phosphatase PrpC
MYPRLRRWGMIVPMTDRSGKAEIDIGRHVVALEWGSCTNVGNIRTVNEDSLLASDPVFVVADGMGGHDGGDVASSIAVTTLASLCDRGAVDSATIVDTIGTANALIHQKSLGTARGMGTTLTGLIAAQTLGGASLMVVNVGDSRTYRQRNGHLSQVTVDHSQVQELIDAGLLDKEHAATHPERNVVTRALGVDPHVDVDIVPLLVEPGDRFLVCSDGLSGELAEPVIEAELAHDGPSAVAARLVDLVLQGPARDNVSVIVVDVVSVHDSDHPSPARSDDTTAPRHRPEAAPVALIDDVPPVAGEAGVPSVPVALIDDVPGPGAVDTGIDENRFE